jgi:hypothetical protein
MRRSGIIITAAAVLLSAAAAGLALAQSNGSVIVRDAFSDAQKYAAYIYGSGNLAEVYASQPVNAVTTGGSVVITTGLTYQQVLASVSSTLRQSVTMPEAIVTRALAQVSQPTSGISNPTSGTSCSNTVQSCNGASQALLAPEDATSHHSMAMGALGVSLVILVAAVYAIMMMKRWS